MCYIFINYYFQMWGDEADKEFSILQYWARIEYYHTKDYQYGEELFKEIFGLSKFDLIESSKYYIF